MANKIKRVLSAALALLICMSAINLPAFANTDAQTNWLGGNITMNIEASGDAYNYMIVAHKPSTDIKQNYYYYETSNHTLKKETTGGGAVHLIPLVDTNAVQGSWTPNGIYNCGESNYDVVYCCDAATSSEAGVYYKRLNLEDSEYYTPEQAKKLRAILTNSYPFVSVEEAKAALKAAGFAQAEELDRSELITATQAAVWSIANAGNGDSFVYNKTATTAQKLTWGGYFHDFAGEITNFIDSTTSRKYITPDGVGDRINALRDFLLALPAAEAEDNQVVITHLDIVNSKISGSENEYNVTLNVELNHGADANDDIIIAAYIDGKVVTSIKASESKNYSLNLKAKANDDIKVVVSGTQMLEKGVYFYAPKPADVNGDGVATSREVSQNLIGVATGNTPVHAEAEVTIRDGNIIEKESTPLYEDKFADVTLEVNGKLDYNAGDSLGVDIIYILGAFLSANQVQTDTMINALTDTFRELIKSGVPVNFGIVPYSSTKDPVLPFVSLTSEADLELLPEVIAAAIQKAGNVYDGVNMENALITATEMFSKTQLGMSGRTDRQHLVMVSSGHTYYFNSGANNEYISTVPVRLTKGEVDTNEIFYMEKAWMRVRNNCTNSYPIPKVFVDLYNANPEQYESLWDCYWSYIDQWAKADIAAGDSIVYNATTREAGNFISWFNSGKYSAATGSNGKGGTFPYSGHGAVIANPDPSVIENILKFDLDDAGTQYGPNPFVHDYAAHAIGNERAMWEAYTYIQENITGKGINFYPIYNPLRADGTATNGSTAYYDWTNQYIGHSFMNMLADGEAIFFSSDKVFFDPIKAEITGTSGSNAGEPVTPFVEDFIGFGKDYDFDFTGNLDKLVLKVNGTAYLTSKVETMNGADATYAFTAPGATKATFTVDYFKGNGTTEERFVWYFMESMDDDCVTLTYQLELVKRSEVVGTHGAQTNQSAILYPNGNRDYGQLFPVPEILYNVYADLESDKNSKPLGNNRFEISLEVPGGDAEVEHDEVILMVDGSYSGDKEWPAMKNAILEIGKAVLDGSGYTQLTLMAFGMGDNEVLVHVKNASELEAILGDLPGYLLRGVSSTNCEAGFTGVAEYITNHDGELKDAIVIYITDGGINTDETPRMFYDWQSYAPNINTVIGYALDGMGVYLPDATQEEKIARVNEIWKDVFEYSNMDINREYPISEAERAFLKYDEDHSTTVRYSFLMAMKNSKFDKYPNVWNRTFNSVFELAKLTEVKDLYLVRYQADSRATWMPEAAAVSATDNIHYVKSDSITTLTEALQGTLGEISKTPYNNVVITDYMSKWVNLNASTLKIVDVTTGETIWSAADGWLIDENRPTAKDVPVIVELVDPTDYENGGADVIGNTNGDIYKLTWYVKDGALLRSDNYKLVYEVRVDTKEQGYKANKLYVANGTTEIHYTDANGKYQTNDIKVPEVKGEAPKSFTISFQSGQASNISFMLIDKETGKVTFLQKIDIGSQTSFEIPYEEGKISAVFVKQSTSGMFWFAEEVDKDVQQAVINCLKANNPSYKGHNAIAFGAGDHDLEFKKGKFATYTFSNGDCVIDEAAPVTPEAPKNEAEVLVPETPVLPETPVVPEAPVVPETPVVPAEPTLNYSVKGGEIANWVVVDGVTAIYIAANGKVPAVIWTSAKVDDATMAEIIEALGADADVKLVGIGAHTIEYKHNKNKTKTITYTFSEIAG